MVQNVTWFIMQKPIFAPENHHGYTWQKTAEHMLSASVHPWPSPIWGTPGSQDTPRPPDTHTHRLLRLQWSRLTTISLHSSRPVAACFTTPDSERSRSRVRFKLELPSAPALGPGLTYCTMCADVRENPKICSLPVWTCLTEMLLYQGLLVLFINLFWSNTR